MAPADLALRPQLTGGWVSDPEPILSHRTMTFRARLRSPDSYGLLLVLILASTVAMAAVSGDRFGRIITLVLLGGTLLFAMWTSRAGHRYRKVAGVLVPIMVLVGGVAATASGGRLSYSIVTGLSALLVIAALAAILARLGTHTSISMQTVLGALSMYLLLGLLFATAFAFLATLSGDAFFAQGAPAGTSVNYVYFSYVTIATLGYGDLSPVGNVGKMLAASEALIGQLFLVTVVALLVSNLGKARRPRRAAVPEGDAVPPGPAAD